MRKRHNCPMPKVVYSTSWIMPHAESTSQGGFILCETDISVAFLISQFQAKFTLGRLWSVFENSFLPSARPTLRYLWVKL